MGNTQPSTEMVQILFSSGGEVRQIPLPRIPSQVNDAARTNAIVVDSKLILVPISDRSHHCFVKVVSSRILPMKHEAYAFQSVLDDGG